MRRLLPGLPLWGLLLLLGPAAFAQTTALSWSDPAPQRVEEFLAIFMPDLAPTRELADYALPVSRLVAIAESWQRGDRLSTIDLILINPDAAEFTAVGEAQLGLERARSLALWWNDREARNMFLRYYSEVYLKEPALGTDPEAFATRFLQGASVVDDTDPAHYLYNHLDRFGYTQAAGMTPAQFLFERYRDFDAALTDAARLGLPLDHLELDLSMYRNAVVARLVNQIAGARDLVEVRMRSVEGWAAVIDPPAVDPVPKEATPLEPAPKNEPIAPIFTVPDDPAAELAITTMDEAPLVEESPELVEPEPEVVATAPDFSAIDIFVVPGTAPISARPIEIGEPEPIEEVTEEEPAPATTGGDPLAFEDPAASGSGEVTLIGVDPALEPVEDMEAPPAIEELPVIEELPDPEIETPEPTVTPQQLEAHRAAGESALTATLTAARQLGQQATELVLLWHAPDAETPTAKATEAEMRKTFESQKQLFLAHLYLLDIYGVHARAQLAQDEADQQVLAALYGYYNEQKDLANAGVLERMLDIDKALDQLGQGISGRHSSTTISQAQQRAYDALKASSLKDLANQLETTQLELVPEPAPEPEPVI